MAGNKRRTFTVVTAGAFGAAAVLTMATPASAAEAWCGSWLEDTSVTSNKTSISGTQGTVSIPYEDAETFEVRKGVYNNKTYFWARSWSWDDGGEASGVLADRKVVMIWRYTGNGGLYECTNYANYQRSGRSSGVPWSQVNRVQAKLYWYNGPSYAPAKDV